jgi:hypothetical protein
MCVRYVGVKSITIECETMHGETWIQIELPTSHDYIPRVHNYLVLLRATHVKLVH